MLAEYFNGEEQSKPGISVLPRHGKLAEILVEVEGVNTGLFSYADNRLFELIFEDNPDANVSFSFFMGDDYTSLTITNKATRDSIQVSNGEKPFVSVHLAEREESTDIQDAAFKYAEGLCLDSLPNRGSVVDDYRQADAILRVLESIKDLPPKFITRQGAVASTQ